jgi:hypothetical protein
MRASKLPASAAVLRRTVAMVESPRAGIAGRVGGADVPDAAPTEHEGAQR